MRGQKRKGEARSGAGSRGRQARGGLLWIALAAVIFMVISPGPARGAGDAGFAFPRPLRVYLLATGANHDVAQQYLSALCTAIQDDIRRTGSTSFSSVTLLLHEQRDDLLAIAKAKLAPGADETAADDLANLFDGLRRNEPSCLPKGAVPKQAVDAGAAVPIGLLGLKVLDAGAGRVEIVRELVDTKNDQKVTVDIPRYETFGKQPSDVANAARTLGASYLGLAATEPVPSTLEAYVAPQDRCTAHQGDASCVRLGGEIALTLSIDDTPWVHAHDVEVQFDTSCAADYDASRRTRSERVSAGSDGGGTTQRSQRIVFKPTRVGECKLSFRVGNGAGGQPPAQTVEVRPSPVFLAPGKKAMLLPEEISGWVLHEWNLVPILKERTNGSQFDRIVREWKTVGGEALVSAGRRAGTKLKGIPFPELPKDLAKRLGGALVGQIDGDGDLLAYRLLEDEYCTKVQETILTSFSLEDPPLNDWGDACQKIVDDFKKLVLETAQPTRRIVVRRGEVGKRFYGAVDALRGKGVAIVDAKDRIFTQELDEHARPLERFLFQPIDSADRQGPVVRIAIRTERPSGAVGINSFVETFAGFRAVGSGVAEKLGMSLTVGFFDNSIIFEGNFETYGVVRPNGTGLRAEANLRLNLPCAMATSALAMGTLAKRWNGENYNAKKVACDQVRLFLGGSMFGVATDASSFPISDVISATAYWSGWTLTPFWLEWNIRKNGPILATFWRANLDAKGRWAATSEVGFRVSFGLSL